MAASFHFGALTDPSKVDSILDPNYLLKGWPNPSMKSTFGDLSSIWQKEDLDGPPGKAVQWPCDSAAWPRQPALSHGGVGSGESSSSSLASPHLFSPLLCSVLSLQSERKLAVKILPSAIFGKKIRSLLFIGTALSPKSVWYNLDNKSSTACISTSIQRSFCQLLALLGKKKVLY